MVEKLFVWLQVSRNYTNRFFTTDLAVNKLLINKYLSKYLFLTCVLVYITIIMNAYSSYKLQALKKLFTNLPSVNAMELLNINSNKTGVTAAHGTNLCPLMMLNKFTPKTL